MLTVHFRCNDEATGQPTPVRLRLTGPEGAVYVPVGRTVEFPTGRCEAVGGCLKLGAERWFYIDGACEIMLPAGVPLRVQVRKGPEYRSLDETVTLGPGQMALRFAIARHSDWRSRGYYPGDTRCHFLPPHAGILEMAAEDLDVAEALAAPIPTLARDGNTYTLTPDLLAFSGQQPALTATGRVFAVNTLNTHPVLGKVGLLHSHRTVFPLSFGGPDDTDDWSVCDWCDQCHRKGGLTVWVEPFKPAGNVIGGESLIAAVLGKIDALEIDPGPHNYPLMPWIYRLWDAGMRLPLVGGSGKDSNRVPLGAMRTYAHITRMGEAQGTSMDSLFLKTWIDVVRAGYTFATSGPLVDLQVEGRRPGEVVDSAGSVEVVAHVESLVAFDRLQVVANGETVVETGAVHDPKSGSWSAGIRESCSPRGPGWMAARCIGAGGFAHTSPLVVRIQGQGPHRRPEPALAKLVLQTREWAETQGRYTHMKRREQLFARADEAALKLGARDARE